MKQVYIYCSRLLSPREATAFLEKVKSAPSKVSYVSPCFFIINLTRLQIADALYMPEDSSFIIAVRGPNEEPVIEALESLAKSFFAEPVRKRQHGEAGIELCREYQSRQKMTVLNMEDYNQVRMPTIIYEYPERAVWRQMEGSAESLYSFFGGRSPDFDKLRSLAASCEGKLTWTLNGQTVFVGAQSAGGLETLMTRLKNLWQHQVRFPLQAIVRGRR